MVLPDEELALDAMLLTEICLGSDVCRSEERKPFVLLKTTPLGRVLLCRGWYCGGLTYGGGSCVGLALTGVLQFEPQLNGGGLKHGVLKREFSGDDNSPPFLRGLVSLGGGGGGRDISDNWLPVNSLPVIGGSSCGLGGGGKLSRERFEL